MTLPAKTLLILGAVIAAMVVGLHLAGRGLFLQPFSQWEEEEARLNMRRYLGALHTCLADFANAVAVWAKDTDISRVLAAGPPTSALDLNALLDCHRLDWLLLFDVQEPAEAALATAGEKKDIPPALAIAEIRAALQKVGGKGRAPCRGIFACGRQLFLFAAVPLAGGESGERREKILAVGRALDLMEIDRLSQLMYLSCTLQHLDAHAAAWPEEGGGGEPIRVHPLNRNLLAVTAPLAAVDGTPLAILRAVYPRRIYLRGALAADHLTLMLTVAALGLALVAMALLERLLLVRFLALEKAVRQVRDGLLSPDGLRCSGQDEISSLANAVADLATSLRRSEQELRAARDSLDDEVRRRTAELVLANAQLEAEIAERQRIAEALRRSQKVEAIGTLAAGIVHEIS
ncbi:MAG: hypothetical protein N3A66_10740, partial [Planctomycetota bacterium]|nr:hypothetical protein [Planctomycetota bacterium]